MSGRAALFALVGEAWLTDLKRRYGEPQRAYHTWDHIEELLAHFEARQGDLHDPMAVGLAILFHDAVYDPTRGDNESLSAELLRDADWPLVDTSSIEFAVQLVEATKAHALPDGLTAEAAKDAAHFLDMDLAILGADEARFDDYEGQVRREYAFVPAEAFAAGRSRILRTFLDKPQLYFSPWGLAAFEDRARSNIARSLDRLASA